MPLVAASTLEEDAWFPELREFGIALRETFDEFAANTSIHGVQYIVDPKGSKTSRLSGCANSLGCQVASTQLFFSLPQDLLGNFGADHVHLL